MDKFLRFFIKFHGYCIAVASSVLTILFTSLFTSAMTNSRVEELYNLRYTGIPAAIFGIAWMAANCLLIIGIYSERKTFLYPFSVLFLIDLFLVIMRDIYLMATEFSWYKTAFFNFTFPFLIFIVPYIILSMIALARLFDIDPIVRMEDNFVRFDRSREENLEGITIAG